MWAERDSRHLAEVCRCSHIEARCLEASRADSPEADDEAHKPYPGKRLRRHWTTPIPEAKEAKPVDNKVMHVMFWIC